MKKLNCATRHFRSFRFSFPRLAPSAGVVHNVKCRSLHKSFGGVTQPGVCTHPPFRPLALVFLFSMGHTSVRKAAPAAGGPPPDGPPPPSAADPGAWLGRVRTLLEALRSPAVCRSVAGTSGLELPLAVHVLVTAEAVVQRVEGLAGSEPGQGVCHLPPGTSPFFLTAHVSCVSWAY